MTTTREAALEAAARKLIMMAVTSGGTAGRDEGLVGAVDAMQAALATPATDPQGLAHIVDYTNWRGETARRVIRPIRLWWGKTEWHPKEQWMLTAWDCEKNAVRDFAWQDMRPVQNPATSAAALAARPAPQPAADTRVVDWQQLEAVAHALSVADAKCDPEVIHKLEAQARAIIGGQDRG